jgi:hypothetical protein
MIFQQISGRRWVKIIEFLREIHGIFDKITSDSGKISPLNPSLKVIVHKSRFCHNFLNRLELCDVSNDTYIKFRTPNKDKDHAFRNL